MGHRRLSQITNPLKSHLNAGKRLKPTRILAYQKLLEEIGKGQHRPETTEIEPLLTKKSESARAFK